MVRSIGVRLRVGKLTVTLSSHFCGHQNKDFKPNPTVFLTLTKWFLCLNLTAFRQRFVSDFKLDIEKQKVEMKKVYLGSFTLSCLPQVSMLLTESYFV